MNTSPSYTIILLKGDIISSQMHRNLFDLDAEVSLLLDTLAMEVSYTVPDSNSLPLLEILAWRSSNSISDAEFSQLYKEWLLSKGATEITKTKQVATMSKRQILTSECPLEINERVLRRCLTVINDAYNRICLETHKDKVFLVKAMDRLFGIFDTEEVYHLRRMQTLVLYELLLISRIYAITPASADTLWMNFSIFEKQVHVVEGRLSLRAFKNFVLENLSLEDVEAITKNVDSVANSLVLYSDCVKAWKRVQKGLTGKNEAVARRILEESEDMFVRQNTRTDDIFGALEAKYGAGFLALHNIDFLVIQSFTKAVESSLRKHTIQLLKLLDSQDVQAPSIQTRSSKAKTIKMRQSVSVKKHLIKRQSMKTPTKFSQEVFTPRKNPISTPGKSNKFHLISPISKSKPNLTPTPNLNSDPHLLQSPKSSTVLQSLSIFKNQRVESFQSVMKRLRKK